MLLQDVLRRRGDGVLFRVSRGSPRGAHGRLPQHCLAGLRQIGFLLLPASAIAAVLAEPIVRLLYQRGEFTAEQTPVVAGALAAFALGLTFNGTMLMLNRSFFSLQSPWVPTWVALGNLVLNGVLAASSASGSGASSRPRSSTSPGRWRSS